MTINELCDYLKQNYPGDMVVEHFNVGRSEYYPIDPRDDFDQFEPKEGVLRIG